MAVLSKEELMTKLSARIGDDTSDEAIALTEDISDTFADLESKANGDGVDWKAEATRIDEEWRKKYKDRFFSGDGSDDNQDDGNDDEPKKTKYTDLFKEGV